MEMAVQVDQWAKINEDLLHEIVQHIDSWGDYTRFRASCKNWYEKLPKIPKYIKTPLLLLPFDDESQIFRPLYHPEEKKVVHRLPLPETKDTVFRGFSHGWLITVGLDETIRMLNPISKVQMHLPPLSTFPGIVDFLDDMDDEEYSSDEDMDGDLYALEKWHIKQKFVSKIILSSAPDDDNQDFMAIALCGEFVNLFYCRRGDKKWTQMTSEIYFNDAIFHKGKIYGVVERCGWIYEYDMKTAVGGLSKKPSSCYFCVTDYEYTYLVHSNDGLLLVVKKVHEIYEHSDNYDDDLDDYCTGELRVFKLDESENNWIEVKNINDYVIVIGLNSSICMLPHTISGNKGKGNRIYYTDDAFDFHGENNEGTDNGIFNFGDETIIDHFPADSNPILSSPIWLIL